MKKFAWRLQRVLDVRIRQEQAKKAELLAVTEKLTQRRSELLTQRRILAELIEELHAEDAARRLSRQALFLRASQTNNALIRRLETEIEQLAVEKQLKIAEVVKLRRFREGLEKLREEARIEFVGEQERLEQKEMDERTTMRFAREILGGRASP
ncbi:MAG TPA: hypothetical protein ENN81_11955 [Phycisphaerales bacterium]|nr:hypothetical protein [Phycisphaerales bacterium]